MCVHQCPRCGAYNAASALVDWVEGLSLLVCAVCVRFAVRVDGGWASLSRPEENRAIQDATVARHYLETNARRLAVLAEAAD